VVEPVQAEVETMYILVFPCRCYGLIDGSNSFPETPEVSLKDSHMQQGILVVYPLSRLHCMIKVTMEIIESRRVIPSLPSIEEEDEMSLSGHSVRRLEELS
jgi:hypothetical protein